MKLREIHLWALLLMIAIVWSLVYVTTFRGFVPSSFVSKNSHHSNYLNNESILTDISSVFTVRGTFCERNDQSIRVYLLVEALRSLEQKNWICQASSSSIGLLHPLEQNTWTFSMYPFLLYGFYRLECVFAEEPTILQISVDNFTVTQSIESCTSIDTDSHPHVTKYAVCLAVARDYPNLFHVWLAYLESLQINHVFIYETQLEPYIDRILSLFFTNSRKITVSRTIWRSFHPTGGIQLAWEHGLDANHSGDQVFDHSQHLAYQNCLFQARRENYNWILFLDTDDFPAIFKQQTLVSLLDGTRKSVLSVEFMWQHKFLGQPCFLDSNSLLTTSINNCRGNKMSGTKFAVRSRAVVEVNVHNVPFLNLKQIDRLAVSSGFVAHFRASRGNLTIPDAARCALIDRFGPILTISDVFSISTMKRYIGIKQSNWVNERHEPVNILSRSLGIYDLKDAVDFFGGKLCKYSEIVIQNDDDMHELTAMEAKLSYDALQRIYEDYWLDIVLLRGILKRMEFLS